MPTNKNEELEKEKDESQEGTKLSKDEAQAQLAQLTKNLIEMAEIEDLFPDGVNITKIFYLLKLRPVDFHIETRDLFNKQPTTIGKLRYVNYLANLLSYAVHEKLSDYMPQKTNREKFEAKEQLREKIKEKFTAIGFDNSELVLTLTDTSSQLISDVVKLPFEDRFEAFDLGEKRVLAALNPPGKSMGAVG